MEHFEVDYNQLKTFNKDIIQVYHQEASKRMDDLKGIESLITDRAYRLFSIYYAVEIAVIGYIFTLLGDSCSAGVINAGMAIVIFTAISIYYAIKVMRPHSVMPAGRAPKNFHIERLFHKFEENKSMDKYAYTMAGELMNLQQKIDSQEKMNIARTKLNNISINFMLLGLVLAIFTFVITVLLE